MSKSQALLNAGFDEVLEDREYVLQTGDTYDRILDLIGPAALRDTFTHTKEGGIICETGLLGGKWTLEDFDPPEDMPANGYLTAFHSGNVTEQSLQEMLDYVAEYKVDCRPEKVFDLSEMMKAHEYLGSSHSFGKVVVMSEQVTSEQEGQE